MLPIIIVCILFVVFYGLNRTLYGNKQFTYYVNIIVALSTLLVALGIIYEASTFNIQRNEGRIQLYLTYPKKMLEEINQLFIDHPEMNYYYNELFNGQPEVNHRDVMIESKINFSILTKIMEQVSVLHYTQDLDSTVFETSLNKIISVFFKSDNFKQYYQKHFKRQFANQYLKSYVATQFGL